MTRYRQRRREKGAGLRLSERRSMKDLEFLDLEEETRLLSIEVSEA